MPRTSDAREMAIQTAERLFAEQGYAATGLTQIIEESGSPKGSFYFHFPGGKRQLALEVLAAYQARTTAAFVALAEQRPSDVVAEIARAVCAEMERSAWARGCLAQVLSQELAPADTEVGGALSALFDEWAAIIGKAAGWKDRSRAIAFVAALEGARTLARTVRSGAPFEAVAKEFAPSSQ